MHRSNLRQAVVVVFAVAGVTSASAFGCGQNVGIAGFVQDDASSSGSTAPLLPDGSACGDRCSDDLQSIVHCNGDVATACPALQQCATVDQTTLGCRARCDVAADDRTSEGCAFFLATPPRIAADGAGGPFCHAVFLVNPLTTPIHVDGAAVVKVIETGNVLAPQPFGQSFYRVVNHGTGVTYEPLTDQMLPGGEVGILALTGGYAGKDACPTGMTTVLQAYRGNVYIESLTVTTDAPVAAFDIYPYGGAQSYVTSSSLLLPKTSWGKQYLTVVAGNLGGANPGGSTDGPYVQILAPDADTHVTFKPSKDSAQLIINYDVALGQKGVAIPVNFLGYPTATLRFPEDLSGSIIESDKPIAVFGGSTCTNVGPEAACDMLRQQLTPTSGLGFGYVAVRYGDRWPDEAPSPWHIVGAVPGTQLTYAPTRPDGAPETLDDGEVAEFVAKQPFSVTSQSPGHPFYFGAMMTGGANRPGYVVRDDAGTHYGPVRPLGDPDLVNVVPVAQWTKHVTFVTDPSYGFTNIVVTRGKDEGGVKQPVFLDCVGQLDGWQSVGDYDYTRVDTMVSGTNVGACTPGKHVAKSDGPFSMTVWGYDDFVSYAYPTGQSVRVVNGLGPR